MPAGMKYADQTPMEVQILHPNIFGILKQKWSFLVALIQEEEPSDHS